jgi:hypothetical protein
MDYKPMENMAIIELEVGIVGANEVDKKEGGIRHG